MLVLDKKRRDDNDVYRCRDCGFLFSPPLSAIVPSSDRLRQPG